MTQSKEFSDIQGFWNSRGENEIDIVAVNDVEKRLTFCEVKRNSRRISLAELENKAKDIIAKYPKYIVEFKGLSLEDM